MPNDQSAGNPPGGKAARPAAHVEASLARSRGPAVLPKAAPSRPAPAAHVARAIQAKPQAARPAAARPVAALPAARPAPAAHVARAIQAKPAGAPPAARPGPGTPLQRKPSPAARIAPIPLPAGRRVVQRMEISSPSSNDDRGNDRRRDKKDLGESSPFGDVDFVGLKGEAITVTDLGGRFSVRVDGREVAYVTYEIERRNPQLGIARDRLRFGYINVSSKAFRSTKLSSLLLFFLANKAASLGLMVIAVGHPDPTLHDYWANMGFDLNGARQRQLDNYASQVDDQGRRLYSDDQLPALQDVTVTEAEIATHTLLLWAQTSYRKYWGPPEKEKKCVIQ